MANDCQLWNETLHTFAESKQFINPFNLEPLFVVIFLSDRREYPTENEKKKNSMKFEYFFLEL